MNRDYNQLTFNEIKHAVLKELRNESLPKNPLPVAVSLLCRAADIQVEATRDPEEQVKILKDTAIQVMQLPRLFDHETTYDEGICELVDDHDDSLADEDDHND